MTNASAAVDDDRIVRLSLHRALPRRKDVVIFGLGYGVAASCAVLAYDSAVGTAALIALPALALLHCLMWLSTHWSVNMRCWVGYCEDRQRPRS